MRSASLESRVMVASSHVTQLQKTKSARVHARAKVSLKKSPASARMSSNGRDAGRAFGSTSRLKSSTRTSAMAPVHGRISTPYARAK